MVLVARDEKLLFTSFVQLVVFHPTIFLPKFHEYGTSFHVRDPIQYSCMLHVYKISRARWYLLACASFLYKALLVYYSCMCMLHKCRLFKHVHVQSFTFIIFSMLFLYQHVHPLIRQHENHTIMKACACFMSALSWCHYFYSLIQQFTTYFSFIQRPKWCNFLYFYSTLTDILIACKWPNYCNKFLH